MSSTATATRGERDVAAARMELRWPGGDHGACPRRRPPCEATETWQPPALPPPPAPAMRVHRGVAAAGIAAPADGGRDERQTDSEAAASAKESARITEFYEV